MISREWKLSELKDSINIEMGQSPKSEYYNTTGDGLPFLQGNRTFGEKYPTFEIYCSDVKKKANIGEVIMSVRAPVGDLNIAPKIICIGRGLCAMNMKNGNNTFLYYLLKHNVHRLINGESGTVFGSVNRKDILNLKVKTASDVNEQKAIADTLSCLDDKIELNNQINKNLEEMAQAIFRSWFIDFEPFQNGEFEDSDLGRIPKGWMMDTLSSVCNVQKGLSYKGIHLVEEGIPMINLGNVKPGGEFRYDKMKYYNGDFRKQHIVKKGDIIIANTDMTSDRLILGSPIFVPDLNSEFTIFTHHLFAFRNLKISKSFIYYYLKSNEFRERAESYANGTTVLSLAKDDVLSIALTIPPEKELAKFDNIVSKITQLKEENKRISTKLVEIRDSLLPKLMNGELRVPIQGE